MKLLGLERHLGREKTLKSPTKGKACELVYHAQEKRQADKQINHQMMQSLHSKLTNHSNLQIILICFVMRHFEKETKNSKLSVIEQ